jgi:hypothetical protein
MRDIFKKISKPINRPVKQTIVVNFPSLEKRIVLLSW